MDQLVILKKVLTVFQSHDMHACYHKNGVSCGTILIFLRNPMDIITKWDIINTNEDMYVSHLSGFNYSFYICVNRYTTKTFFLF